MLVLVMSMMGTFEKNFILMYAFVNLGGLKNIDISIEKLRPSPEADI